MATLIQTSMGPSRSSAALAAASRASRLRASSASFMPGPAKRRTVARPTPLDAPVMTTTSDMRHPVPAGGARDPGLRSWDDGDPAVALEHGVLDLVHAADPLALAGLFEHLLHGQAVPPHPVLER